MKGERERGERETKGWGGEKRVGGKSGSPCLHAHHATLQTISGIVLSQVLSIACYDEKRFDSKIYLCVCKNIDLFVS